MFENLRTKGSVFGPLISVLAVILGLVLVGPISPAGATDNGNNDDCVPSDAVAASFSNWAFNHWTSWSSSDAAPADTDGDGALDPGNLSQVGDREQTQVSNHDGYTETVTDHAAWVETIPAVPAIWANFSPNDTNAPLDTPPTWDTDPRGTWQVHNQIPDGHADEPDGVYDMANGNGHSDWFYKQSPVDEQTINHPAVTHDVVHADTTHTEYRWSILTRTYTSAKDAVTCNQDENPRGSNGHVKVDDDNLDGDTNNGHGNGGNDNGNGNDPHLNCTFNIEWYGYDTSKDIYSTVNFISQAPTADTAITVVSGDTHPKLDSNGGWVETYTLSFSGEGDPQHNHGYHVMITIDTEGTLGSDQKHKVFWVENCPVEDQEIPVTPAVSMDDQCGTANDSGPTYTTENDYWTTTEGEGAIAFHAKEGYVFPAGDHTSEDGKTYTVSYTPNTDVACTEVLPEDATASVSTLPASCTGAGSLVLGDDIANATWGEPAIENNTFSVVATAASGHLFAAGDGVSGDQTTETFTGSLQPAFTQQQIEDNNCVEVAGEQTGGGHPGHHSGHNPGHQNAPEVKGEQAHAAPAASAAPAVVPTEVEAGLAGTPGRIPNRGTSNNLPLWALSLGAGMFLIGAGRLRRTGRTTR